MPKKIKKIVIKDEDIKREERPKLLIATPMYGGMCTGHYMGGVLATIEKMRSVGVKVYFAQVMNESLITRARNELARVFMESDCDYLMFIDADIAFDGNAVAQLMAVDRDIVCGIYPKKEIDWKQVEQAAKLDKENLAEYAGAFVINFPKSDKKFFETDEDGVVEVRHGGTGFMLIKRRVFEKLKKHVPTYRASTVKKDGSTSSPSAMNTLQPALTTPDACCQRITTSVNSGANTAARSGRTRSSSFSIWVVTYLAVIFLMPEPI
jgi:hypothetical protein